MHFISLNKLNTIRLIWESIQETFNTPDVGTIRKTRV